MLSAAKHLAAAATHRLVPLGYRRCLQELPLACGERVTFLTGKVTKAMSARGDGRRAGARRLPCAACRPRAGANSPIHGLEHARLALAPVCAARRRPRARKIKSSVSEPSIHGTVFPARPLLAERSIGSFSPPSARRTPEGSARRASARGKATRLRPAKGRRAEPNALGRSRGRGDLASARCASLGTLARRTPGMVIGAPRRRPRTRAAGVTAGGRFFGQLSFKRKWPARRQPSGTRRCADGATTIRCFAAQTLRYAQGDNNIQTPPASGGGQKPNASLRRSLAPPRATAEARAP